MQGPDFIGIIFLKKIPPRSLLSTTFECHLRLTTTAQWGYSAEKNIAALRCFPSGDADVTSAARGLAAVTCHLRKGSALKSASFLRSHPSVSRSKKGAVKIILPLSQNDLERLRDTVALRAQSPESPK